MSVSKSEISPSLYSAELPVKIIPLQLFSFNEENKNAKGMTLVLKPLAKS